MRNQNKVKETLEYFKTCDPFEIAGQLGFKILYRNYSKSIKGYTIFIDNKKFIIINNVISSKYHALIVAHELAHYFFHRPHKLNDREIYNENFANYFAVNLIKHCPNMDKSFKRRINIYLFIDFLFFNIINFISKFIYRHFVYIFKF